MKSIENIVNKFMPMLEAKLTSESKSGIYGPVLLSPYQNFSDGNQFDLALFEKVYLFGRIEPLPPAVSLTLASVLPLITPSFVTFPIKRAPDVFSLLDNTNSKPQKEKIPEQDSGLFIDTIRGYRYFINLDEEINIIKILPKQIISPRRLGLSEGYHLYLANNSLFAYVRQEYWNLSSKR
jgi:hypothetical protein